MADEFSEQEIRAALNMQETARILGVSVRTVRRLADERRIGYVIVGSGRGRKMFPRRAIAEYVNAGHEQAHHHRAGGRWVDTSQMDLTIIEAKNPARWQRPRLPDEGEPGPEAEPGTFG